MPIDPAASDVGPSPMATPRQCVVRCPCGWEQEVTLDLANDPPVWVFKCPAVECGAIYTVKLAFDVEMKVKTRKKREWGVRAVE
jgi:hypothetical protein